MDNTYTWTVGSMDNYPSYQGEVDVICSVNWSCTGTNGTHTAYMAGATGIPFYTRDVYIPYANLTNDIVIEWVHTAMGEEGVAAILADIDGQLNAASNPKIASPLPWIAA